MKSQGPSSGNYIKLLSLVVILLCLLSSCGYRIIGSQPLPFNAVTIKPVQNRTYEPRLEERLHNALSTEFINQGIEVKAGDSNVVLEATVTKYMLGAIAAINEFVKEQEITMSVDIKMIENEQVFEFQSMTSPIKITYQSTGSVSESAAEKETATDKACREIAKEVVSRIIVGYAK